MKKFILLILCVIMLVACESPSFYRDTEEEAYSSNDLMYGRKALFGSIGSEVKVHSIALSKNTYSILYERGDKSLKWQGLSGKNIIAKVSDRGYSYIVRLNNTIESDKDKYYAIEENYELYMNTNDMTSSSYTETNSSCTQEGERKHRCTSSKEVDVNIISK